MIKVLTIFGTRPEAIKMAPVVKELEKHSDRINCITCVTAQHREMLDQVLNVFNISPDYDLNIMEQGQTLTSITSKVLNNLDNIIAKESPDLVLVHGDTTTTFAAALSAFYHKIKIGHVEAGLRTYNKYSPFPEEINREFVSRVADYNFAPTDVAAENLIREGVDKKTICITGNTAIDAIKTTVSSKYKDNIIDWVGSDKLILLTAHRRENLGDPMRNIFRAIKRVLNDNPGTKVIYPIHMNPAISKIADEIFDNTENLKIIPPLEVYDFHNIMKRSYLILTDSGGIQEEAPSLGKPVLVLRNTTERPEGVAAGTLKLVGTNEDKIYELTCDLLRHRDSYERMAHAKNPYGDGHASEKIAKFILDNF